MTYEVHVMQGDTLHTYFTDEVRYNAVPVDEHYSELFVECVPRNGPQRGGLARFPIRHVVSVTERNNTDS